MRINMKISTNGLAIVKAFESCLSPVKGRPGYFKQYIDPVGVPTIGWGHTNHHDPKFDGKSAWSQAECDAVLASDMATFERHVCSLAKVVLEQHEFDALVSWAFNTGGPATSSVWTALNSGNKAAVPAKLAAWNKGGGKVLAGLTRRRKAEGLLFQGKFAEAFKVAGVAAPKPSMTPVRKPPVVPVPKPAAAPAAGAVVAGGVAAGAAASQGANLWIVAVIAVVALVAGFIIWKSRKG